MERSADIGNGELELFRDLLVRFQVYVRDHVIESRKRESIGKLGEVATVTEADTIYHIDRLTELGILDWFGSEWPREWPAQLVMEGIEDSDTIIVPVKATPRLKIIIDPIDGTRELIHDKRSAWVLTGVAPYRGDRTDMGDLFLAVMTEIPTTRQWRSDQVSGFRGAGPGGIRARAYDLVRGGNRALELRPSAARGFDHGFASFVRFFLEGKGLLASMEEAFWQAVGQSSDEKSSVFEDQYLSTGGQIYELLAGRDRMVGDLRPLALEKLGLVNGLVCHPYDICTALLLEEAGGVVIGPDGGGLKARLNTTAPVSWIGFANRDLADLAMPVIQNLIPRFF
jgi:fructose-1,6-bisphosphatase/inositol monophosphatase family enzyme